LVCEILGEQSFADGSAGHAAFAAEGAFSNNFPGAYGTVAVAIPPAGGWTYLNTSIFYAAEAELKQVWRINFAAKNANVRIAQVVRNHFFLWTEYLLALEIM